MLGIALLFPLEYWLGLPVLTLAPVLGIINGMVFLAKAGMLSGEFYIWSALLFVTAGLMALLPDYAHLIFGVVSAACFFFPGLNTTGNDGRHPGGIGRRRKPG
jgi:serine/threonine-protein kinase